MPENDKNFFWKDIIRFVIISALIVLPIRAWVAQPFIVRGASMEPTLGDGDYLIIDELSYNFRDPKRGEVIVFKFPEDTSKFFIKRVVGLPGETIEIRDNKVFIIIDSGSEELGEEYLSEALTTPNGVVNLDDDEYFVLGDNRLFSSDSRRWGALDNSLIIGRTLLRLWPLNSAGVFPGFYEVKTTPASE
jgi:signal peptidase I